MMEYISKGDEHTLRAAGSMTEVCAETTYLIHRLWVALGDRGEEFKQTITGCINDPASPVFRKGDATANPMENATANPMEVTPWQREMALYEGAVEKFGEMDQIDQAIEEMAELTVALNKYKRCVKHGHGAPDAVMEDVQVERADVEIMLNQLAVIFGDNSEKELEKLAHLALLLNKKEA